MTNSDHTQTTAKVALIALPGLREALTDAGFTVIGGHENDYRSDVAEARNAMESGVIPVLVANPPEMLTGMLSFVNKTAPMCPVLLVDFGALGPLAHAHALRFAVPANLSSLVSTINQALPPFLQVHTQNMQADPEISANGVVDITSHDSEATQTGVNEGVSPWMKYQIGNASAIPAQTQDEWSQGPVQLPVIEPIRSAPEPKNVEHRTVTETPVSAPQQANRDAGAPMGNTPSWLQAEAAPAPAISAPTWAQVSPQPVATPTPLSAPTPQPYPVPVPSAFEPTPRRGIVIIVCAAKGGAAKTTTSRVLAERAGVAGLRTVLIDGNGGQDGQRKMLRIGDGDLPSIFDFAHGAIGWKETICTPDQINSVRPRHLAPVHFAAVLAPTSATADHRVVTPALYEEITEWARTVADVVIVDTQTIETPALRDPASFPSAYIAHMARDQGAHLLALFDKNTEAYALLFGSASNPGILAGLFQLGVNPNQVTTMATRVTEGVEFDDRQFADGVRGFGTFIGHTADSAEMAGQLNAGQVCHDHPTVAAVLDAALLHITGDPRFSPAPQQRRKLGLLRGRQKR